MDTIDKKDEWKQEGTVPEFGDPENSNNQSSVKNPVTDADKSHDDSEKWTEHTIDYTPVPLVPTDHNKKPVNAKKQTLNSSSQYRMRPFKDISN